MDLDPYLRYESLVVREAASGVLWLAMRQDMLPRAHDEIGRIFLDIDRDPDIRVVLVGGDDEHGEPDLLDFMRQITEDWDLRMAVMREASALVNNIINCSKPVVSLLPGAVTPVALVSDVTIASRSAVIIDAHASYGAVTGDHAVLAWPLLCGMAKTKYHLLLAEPLTGEEAERIGLVSMCVDDEQLQQKGIEVCERLAAAPQRAIRWTKSALNNWYRMAGPIFDASLALEFISYAGPDTREFVDAMSEQRPPVFREQF
jgi:enoyl-CoA hydratase